MGHIAVVHADDVNLLGDNIVACFPHAETVEVRSLETGTQQKKNECL
jgi:hypothetical protein